ncbi:hypothetical protein HK098_001825 [Nowakowskiella sp. JEL0407]|nr:hypothetical protein HK098_001825 [Nowakowskiella sp. JEL0407]
MLLNQPSAPRPRKIAVLGAGVQGLAAACLLKLQGHKVTIFSKSSPKSPQSDPYYTSPRAGASWQSYASAADLRLRNFDEITFRSMWKLSEHPNNAAGIMRTIAYQYYEAKPENFETPWFCESGLTPNYRVLEKGELPRGVEFGYVFDTVLINPPKFLNWLLERFEALDGEVVLEEIMNLSDLYNRDADVDIVVNCSGYGAKSLGGVSDATVEPGRGQTILVHAPQVKKTISIDIRDLTGERLVTYIIPRDDGSVILGGTYQLGNNDINPDPKTAEGIMERCVEICPDLREANGNLPKILKHDVGLRPVRADGIRLEPEIRGSEKFESNNSED